MQVLLALTPVVLTLGLLLTRLPAWVAPAAGAVLAVVLAPLVFGIPLATVGAALLAGAPTAVEILAIIAGGITLSRIMEHTGAHERLGDWLSAGAGPTLATGLLMVHGVIPFLESVTGFGVSLIVGIPLMIGLGYTALRSAAMTVFALTIGPWGSMAPGTLLGAQLGGFPERDLGFTTALFNVPASLMAGIMTVLILRGSRGFHMDEPPARTPVWLGLAVVSGVAQAALILLANLTVGVAPAGAVGCGLVALLWLIVIRRGRLTPGPGRDIVPYLVLLAGTIAGTGAVASLGLGGAAGTVLSSPALWSATAAVVGAVILHLDHAGRRSVPREAARLWVGTAIPTALYVVFGFTLAAGGTAAALAGALGGLGPVFLAISPFLGGVSGYITASNTGAMALFGTLQMQAGGALGVPPAWIGGLHNASAGWAVIASPARITVAYRMAAGAQTPQMPGWAVSPRTLLAVLAPGALVGLVIMSAMAVIVLPRV